MDRIMARQAGQARRLETLFEKSEQKHFLKKVSKNHLLPIFSLFFSLFFSKFPFRKKGIHNILFF